MGTKSKDAEALTREQAETLYERIRAIESLEADKKDIQDDITQQKTLVVETLPIQKDVLDFVLKRRKHSRGIVNNFDTMLQLVEEALQEVETEHAEETRDRIKTAYEKHSQPDLLDSDEDDEDDAAHGVDRNDGAPELEDEPYG